MSFKACTLTMQISGGTLAPERLADLFAALGDVFAPFELSFRIDREPHTNLARCAATRHHSMALWLGEELGSGVLTRCSPDASHDLVGELRRSLAGRSGTTAWASATGALRHRGAGDAAPAWYGRWASQQALRELATVRFEWSDEAREFELTFPLDGYPVMPARLLDDYTIVDGDEAIAAANRELVLPVLERVRAALALDADQVEWSVQGDAGFHHPDAAADLENVWLPRLRGA